MPEFGEKNHNWKGGRYISSHGYVMAKDPAKYKLPGARAYSYEHRLVAEKKLGRRLQGSERAHHVNGDKTDNRPENIEVVCGNAEHFLLHRKPGSNRRLPGEANPVTSCNCGCGGTFRKFDTSGRPRRYVSGHNTRREKQHAI